MSEAKSKSSPPASSATQTRDPLEAVFKLGSRRLRTGILLGIAGGLLVHGAAAGHGYAMSDLLRLRNFAAVVRADLRSQLRMTFDIEVEEEKAPEPEPVAEPEPTEPEPPPVPKVEAPEPKADPNPPPPAAAEAAKLLTAESDPDAPLDLTGFTMITGNAERSPGGLTAASGKSKKPVYDRSARADGIGARKGHDPAKPVAPSIDLSRSANIAGSASWNCPFPSEADLEQINYRRVGIVVNVGANGTPTNVAVVNNGDTGFGAAAKACALRKRYAPALDRSGKPVAGSLRVNVTFQR